MNSDAQDYGGSGAGNLGMVRADEEGWANITIPPFATLMLELDY
jgi:1,4-alpha-glucan branching enzyme